MLMLLPAAMLHTTLMDGAMLQCLKLRHNYTCLLACLTAWSVTVGSAASSQVEC